MKHYLIASLCGLSLLLCGLNPVHAAKVKLSPEHWNNPAGKECVSCHTKSSVGLTKQWEKSAHAKAQVNCLDCHQANSDDADAIEHEGQIISPIVSPKDCGRCHETEYEEQKGSTHAKAFTKIEAIMPELLNLNDAQQAVANCGKCHGTRIKIRGDGTPDPTTWPSSGIGRINPDGSKGSCSACHGRHRFDVAEARDPAGCMRCHSGQHAPDYEIYSISKHGMSYAVHRDEMNLNSESWKAGVDYAAAPTCATCHMGAAGKLPSSHDVGMRNSWRLNGVVSEQRSLVIFADGDKRDLLASSEEKPRRGKPFAKDDGTEAKVKAVAPPKVRRQAMSLVCLECHAKPFISATLKQFDNQVELYNNTFAKPALAIMQGLYAAKKITPVAFDDPIEHSYWKLWHDAGISARHGAAMGSPSHAWWEGLHQVRQVFYGEFLPNARALGADDLIKQHVAQPEAKPSGFFQRGMNLPETTTDSADADASEQQTAAPTGE